jgi:hypothetical protein
MDYETDTFTDEQLISNKTQDMIDTSISSKGSNLNFPLARSHSILLNDHTMIKKIGVGIPLLQHIMLSIGKCCEIYEVMNKLTLERRACKIIDRKEFLSIYGEDELKRCLKSAKYMIDIVRTVCHL